MMHEIEDRPVSQGAAYKIHYLIWRTYYGK